MFLRHQPRSRPLTLARRSTPPPLRQRFRSPSFCPGLCRQRLRLARRRPRPKIPTRAILRVRPRPPPARRLQSLRAITTRRLTCSSGPTKQSGPSMPILVPLQTQCRSTSTTTRPMPSSQLNSTVRARTSIARHLPLRRPLRTAQPRILRGSHSSRTAPSQSKEMT
jgi:hypothetical protein